MELYEREFFIARIISGYIQIDEIRVDKPSIDIIYKSNILYKEIIESAKYEDCITDDDIEVFLIEQNLWTEEDDNQLNNVLPKHVDYWKSELYKAWNNESEREKIRLFLNRAKEEITRLFGIRHQFDHLTTHGIGIFAKWQFLVENSLVNPNKRPITDILDILNKNSISEDMIRELSRTEPWRSIWSASKKCSSIFPCSGSELSDDQRKLINWSTLYDNIHEYPDCPSDEIIADDDALDGWLILKRKENETEKNKREIENRVGNKNCDEVFVPISSAKEAKKIYDMNDPTNKAIINNRLKIIQEKGEAKDTDFVDVRLKMLARKNNG